MAASAKAIEQPNSICAPLSTDLCWLLSRASYTLTTRLTSALEAIAMSPRAYAVLAAAQGGEHTQTELARLVGLDKTTMVVTIDELERAGLAERKLDEADRRARVISVTAAGQLKIQQARAIVEQVRRDVLAVLPADERRIFLQSLAKLVGDPLAHAVACTQPVRRRAPRTAPAPGV